MLRLQDFLHVITPSGWQLVPEWCDFYFQLGAILAEQNNSATRTVVGLAVPTRAYAAPFAALGVVCVRAKVPLVHESDEECFAKLSRLPVGERLIYIFNGHRLKAVYEGLDDSDGDKKLRVRVEDKKSGGLTYFIHAEDAKSLEISERETGELPATQRGRPLLKNQSFVEKFLPEIDLNNFAGRSRLECAILGRLNVLRDEVVDTKISLKTVVGKRVVHVAGALQDVLRTSRFGSTTNAVRSIVMRPDGKGHARGLGLPQVCIFDGAESYLKSRSSWTRSASLVILDATETGFQSGVEALNQEYTTSRLSDLPPMLPAPPAGVELVAYQVRVI